MAAKVKYPVRAALARFLPVDNHLNNMRDYLLQAGKYGLAGRVNVVQSELKHLEAAIKPLREK